MSRYKQTRQEMKEKWKNNKIGQINYNKEGLKMTIIDYIDYDHIIVQFEDDSTKETSFNLFRKGEVVKTKPQRLNEIAYNKEGYKMFIKEYHNSGDIIVEFCDEYHGQVHTSYESFQKRTVKNPNRKGKYGQITGNEYKTRESNGEKVKEYNIWMAIIKRVFNAKKEGANNILYKDVQICQEWMYYPNFVRWIRSQSNYDKWKQGINHEWSIDKDILSPLNNKIYSPETCCLVPSYINSSVIDGTLKDKILPLGVRKFNDKYYYFYDKETNKNHYFKTVEETQKAFIQYKNNKRKEMAKEAYKLGEITQQCYEALIDDNFLFR